MELRVELELDNYNSKNFVILLLLSDICIIRNGNSASKINLYVKTLADIVLKRPLIREFCV